MKREIVGQVTPEEKNEIEHLYKRKISLESLIKSVDLNSEHGNSLYEKIVSDMEDVSYNFNSWWMQKAEKYNWKNLPGGKWEINFDTGKVSIVYN